jgi:pyruvate formate lyase activating enzyme
MFECFMLIGGLQKLSLLDYPDKTSAIIFTVGCNFRCGFCHNPDMVKSQIPNLKSQISEDEILNFLKERVGLLDAVVITGGEPTMHADLPELIKKIKALGFLIKLDTNGTNPVMVESLIKEKLVDYWAMDIKGPWDKYEAIVNRPVKIEDIKKSVELIMNSGVDYEFRTTLVQGLHSLGDAVEMAKQVAGAKKFYWQKFIPRDRLVDMAYIGREAFTQDQLVKVVTECKKWVKECEVRG